MPKRIRIAAVWIALVSFAGESTGAPSLAPARFISPMPMPSRLPAAAGPAVPDLWTGAGPVKSPIPDRVLIAPRAEPGRVREAPVPAPLPKKTGPPFPILEELRLPPARSAPERTLPENVERRVLESAARFTYFEQGGGLFKPSPGVPKERRGRLRAAPEYGFLEKEDPNRRAGLYYAIMGKGKTVSASEGERTDYEYIAGRDAPRTQTYRDEHGGSFTYDENGVVRAQTIQRVDADGKAHVVKMVQRYDKTRPYGHRNQFTYISDGVKTVSEASPLVFDLDGNGIGTSRRSLNFDLDGDGAAEEIHDILSGDALLAFDADKDGIAGESGLELFGDRTDLDGDGKPDGYKDGFEALKALVKKAVREGVLEEGVLESRRLDSSQLDALGRAYGLSLRMDSLSGKAASLLEAGVVEVALSSYRSKTRKDFDGRGNSLMRRNGAVFLRSDGSPGTYADLWFGL